MTYVNLTENNIPEANHWIWRKRNGHRSDRFRELPYINAESWSKSFCSVAKLLYEDHLSWNFRWICMFGGHSMPVEKKTLNIY